MIDVSIILVNYKTNQFVLDVIKDIRANSFGFTYEIIVVDNSCDHELFCQLTNFLKSENVLLIDAKENLGFGKANNLGAAHSSGKYVHFLNTDVKLIGNSIFELYRFLEDQDDDERCIAGSNLYSIEQKPNHSFRAKEKNIKSDFLINSGIQHFFETITKKRSDFNYSSKAKEIKGYVCGASLMMSRKLFDLAGGFDDEIFMYAEEALLCRRCRKILGAKVFNVPSSRIIHFEGGSGFTMLSDSKISMIIDGNYVYYKKSFSEKKAISFLKKHISLYKFKCLFSRKKRKINQMYLRCYQQKYNLMKKTCFNA